VIAGTPLARSSATPSVVRIQVSSGGFDWADAGIGAAGGLALALVAVGGVLVRTEHPARRIRNTATIK
jgi:hypothetical protein